jgi:hypothetical protein
VEITGGHSDFRRAASSANNSSADTHPSAGTYAHSSRSLLPYPHTRNGFKSSRVSCTGRATTINSTLPAPKGLSVTANVLSCRRRYELNGCGESAEPPGRSATTEALPSVRIRRTHRKYSAATISTPIGSGNFVRNPTWDPLSSRTGTSFDGSDGSFTLNFCSAAAYIEAAVRMFRGSMLWPLSQLSIKMHVLWPRTTVVRRDAR